MFDKLNEFFFARHSIKADKKKPEDAESQQYKGITEKGVELSRQKAQEVLKMLDQAEAGSVLFIGGASEQIRTKSTGKVFGDEIKEILARDGRNDILALTEADIADRQKGYTEIVQGVSDKINASPDKKVLIDYPMLMKEFSMKMWLDEKGNFSEYTNKLLAKNNNNSTAAMKDWIESEGKLDDMTGPNPTKIAEDSLEGIERLREFAKKYIKDRPVIVGAVGHSWNFDALAVYLANNGKVNGEGFAKVGGELIKDSEIGMVEIDKEGSAVLKYKGKEFPIELLGN